MPVIPNLFTALHPCRPRASSLDLGLLYRLVICKNIRINTYIAFFLKNEDGVILTLFIRYGLDMGQNTQKYLPSVSCILKGKLLTFCQLVHLCNVKNYQNGMRRSGLV
jgi:hypothetical protein